MNKRKVIIFSFSLFVIFCLNLNAQTNEYKDLSSRTNCFHLAPDAEILEDTENELHFREVIELDAEQFFRLPSKVPYLDFTRSTFWIRVKIKNSSDSLLKFYLETARPLTNRVTLYRFNENKQLLDSLQTGDEFPFRERYLTHRNFIFPIYLKPNSKQVLLVKAVSDGEILKLPLKFCSISEFSEFSGKEHFFLGLYYGFLCLVIILFAFFGFALRQKLYTFFVFYVFFLVLFQFSLDGLAYQYLWPDYPWLGNHAILIFAACSILALLIYADTILEFYKIRGAYYWVYRGLYLVAFLGLIGSFLSGSLYALTFPVLNGFSLIMVLYFFIGIYIRHLKGKKTNLSLMAAFVFLWLGAIVFVSCNVNLVSNEFLAANALKIGSAIEVTFLSIAMAGRYRENQKEKMLAQEMATKRLEEVNKLKSRQTKELEEKVKVRTEEISTKNKILSSQNKEIINSINYAKRLQEAILPSMESFESQFKDSGILFLPKDIVSGDFYWLEGNENHLFFAVADCTGHGVPGALVSVVGYNALNRCINELKLSDPAEILDQMTVLVEQTFSKNQNTVSDGMDICLCVWDYRETIEFAGAFNPLYLIRNNELVELKGNKQPIGKFIKRSPFEKHQLKVQPGDTLCLFSDGYADQFGGKKGKKLKYANFKRYLKELSELPASKMTKKLKQRFDQWKGNEEQIDDVCLMLVDF